ncbi:Long-chain fatty acid transport protein [Alphaproteobacteria bacterium SO-S41]|nr:Long-chain fatty acid transport protein [Alphaproteobacteria bacterium SO-S41]
MSISRTPRTRQALSRLALSTAALGLLAGSAAASGFAVNEQSVLGLGRAFSGEVARGGDASSLWYNPALMTDFDRPTATTGIMGIFSSGTLANRGTTIRGPGTGGATLPVSGVDGEDPLDPGYVPNASFIMPIGQDWWLGLNVNAPFGLVVDYADGYFGRYDSTRTELFTLNIQGSVAWKVSDNFSIGFGVDAQRGKATLDNALPNLGPLPDGAFKITGDDWAWGWNAGFTWAATDKLRFGAHYRSEIDHDLQGTEIVSGLVGPLAGSNRIVGGSAALTTPAMASAGFSYDVDAAWSVTGQVNWYQWSNFDEIRVVSPGQPDLVNAQNYKDSWSYALGAEYRFSPDWTWRAGLMYEETPTQEGFRTTRVPDSDRIWIATGATWQATDNASLDVSLAYVALDDVHVQRTDVLYEGTPVATTVGIDAELKDADAIIVGLGGSWRF